MSCDPTVAKTWITQRETRKPQAANLSERSTPAEEDSQVSYLVFFAVHTLLSTCPHCLSLSMSELIVHNDPPREPATQSNIDLPSAVEATQSEDDELRKRLDKVLYSEVRNTTVKYRTELNPYL